MEEGQVTVDGIIHKIPTPFIVLATQNPTGAAGTQLLPDSQMARFSNRLSLGDPSVDDEVSMVMGRQGRKPMEELTELLNAETLAAMQEDVDRTYIGELVVKYVVSLIDATRNNVHILRGASPRATLAVTAMAKAVAQLRGRDYVTPKDVQEVFLRTIAHRLQLTARAEAAGMTSYQVLAEILETVPAPKTH